MPNRLAIDGGEPTFPSGPPGWPIQDEDVQQALQQAYADGNWGRYDGPAIERLVAELAAMHQVKNVLPCCSGTIAVELALRGLGVQSDEEVLLAGYDFPGNFRAIEAIGARPVLVDIDPSTWTMAADAADSAVSSSTRAIVVSHLHGGLADMPALRAVADRHALSIVEDACQSPGAIVAGKPAGTWGDVGVLSFGGSKLLTAGRGGALLTNDPRVFQRAKIFCERGNLAFPLSELQAAVLVPQIQKLADRNAVRSQNVQRLQTLLEPANALAPIRVDRRDAASQADDSWQSAFYKLAWRLDAKCAACAIDRDSFLRAIQAEGIALDTGFRGFARRSGKRCRQSGSLTNATQAAEQTVILHHPVLLESPAVIGRLARAIRRVTERFSTP